MQVQEGNNLMYIPLDKLMERSAGGIRTGADSVQIESTPATEVPAAPLRRGRSAEGGSR
jgi:hypothetical protein